MIRLVLELSTAHLSARSRRLLLDEGGESIFVVPHDFGFFVQAHDPGKLAADINVPEDLFNVFTFARREACDWIHFDADANVIAELATYEWPEAITQSPNEPIQRIQSPDSAS